MSRTPRNIENLPKCLICGEFIQEGKKVTLKKGDVCKSCYICASPSVILKLIRGDDE